MQLIDWIVVTLPLLIVLAIGIYTQRYLKSVSDFLSAGRGTGRYLLAVSRGESQGGAVVFVASFEVISHSGFTLAWWGGASLIVSVIITITGFVFYRYRETRAMTLAQFFELRYSKSFRLFAGVVGFFSGVLNFAVIPVVGARCLCYFVQFPPMIRLFSVSLPTEILVLAVLLSITTLLTLTGGLITVVITNGTEGIISLALYLVLIFTAVRMFSWHDVNQVLVNHPHGESFLNPFDSSKTKDFNIWFVVMNMFLTVYATMAWQNQSGYNSAGTTPHESRMAGIVGRWLMSYKGAMTVLLALCAMTYLNHPHYAAGAAEVRSAVARIPDHHTQQQMLLPVALSHLLPPGVRGALCIILMMGVFGGDGGALHSWGSLAIQDILVPLRKTPLDPKRHILYLRLSILCVAVFSFAFGILFRQTEYLAMWWAVTGAVFVGGSGAAIIGGLYWSKGTAAGAWAGMLTGSILSVGGITLREFNPNFPLNGVQISFYATLIASFTYVVTSLLTHKENFNMDRMLHRGTYATIAGPASGQDPKPKRGLRAIFIKLIGIDEDFNRGDKWLAISVFVWAVLWFFVFVIGTVWNVMAPWPTAIWSQYWLVTALYIPIILTVIVAIWFTWGSLRDMRAFFRHLRQEQVNICDDGTVLDHHNLGEGMANVQMAKKAPKSEAPALTIL